MFPRWSPTFSKRQLTVGRKWRHGTHERLDIVLSLFQCFAPISAHVMILLWHFRCLRMGKIDFIINEYVIKCSKHWNILLRSWRSFNLTVNRKLESEVVSFSVHCLMTWYVYKSYHNCVGNNIVVVLLVLVKICHNMTQRCFMLCTTYKNLWSITCPLEVRCLTPLSKIFQLLHLWRKLEYPEKSTDLSQITDKL
jgi:hypothetical protein